MDYVIIIMFFSNNLLFFLSLSQIAMKTSVIRVILFWINNEIFNKHYDGISSNSVISKQNIQQRKMMIAIAGANKNWMRINSGDLDYFASNSLYAHIVASFPNVISNHYSSQKKLKNK